MKRSIILIVSALFVSLVACSDDDDDKGGGDVAASCKSLCTTAGFGDGRADVQPHEINCFCTGGSGTITAAACADMCKSTDKSGSQPFGNGPAGANACQCQ